MKESLPKKHTHTFLLLGVLILFGVIFSATLLVSRLLGRDDFTAPTARPAETQAVATTPAPPAAESEVRPSPVVDSEALRDPARHAAQQAAQLRAVYYEQRALGDVDTLTLDEEAIRELQESGALIH